MMDLALSEQQEMLKKAARDFLVTECPKSLVRQMEGDERGYSPELWQKIAKLGWLGLIFPEKYGGGGGEFLDLVVLLEETGRACLPGPFFSTAVLCGLTILEAGNEIQKRALLSGIAKGDLILTLAISEPDTLHDYDLKKTKLEAVSKGEDYILSGIKLFVPYAPIADDILCVAKTGNDTVTIFVVDGNSPGVSCTLLQTTSEENQYEVVFDNVKTPRENILGELDGGSIFVENVMSKAAVAKCAQMLGYAQQVLEMSVSYAKQRIQFERPIGSFQAIQHHCANMATDVDISRLITYEVAWRISKGLSHTVEAAMAKAWVSEACRRIISLGHEIHGGVGFITDHDMPLYYGRSREAEVTLGGASFHREIVARELGLYGKQ